MVIVGKRVVRAPNFIVNVLAEFRRIGVGRTAHLETEHSIANEVDPFNYLCVSLITCKIARFREVLERCRVHAEAIGEYDPTERVSLFVCTVRIELFAYRYYSFRKNAAESRR